jgi:hypothetical protein
MILFQVIGVLSEVIAPEFVAHLIASGVRVQYNKALNVLRDEAAWEYGRMIDNTPDRQKVAMFVTGWPVRKLINELC